MGLLLHSLPPYRHDDGLRFRRMSRAGAALYELVYCEQRIYPWKLFGVLEDASYADEVAEDAATCMNLLDPITRQHLHAYPNAEALRTKESICEVQAVADNVTEHTGRIERGHAYDKRANRGKDQTHAARLLASSANRVLARHRREQRLWHANGRPPSGEHPDEAISARQERNPKRKNLINGGLVDTQASTSASARAVCRRARNSHQRHPTRARRVSRRAAWFAVHAAGRMVTAVDHRRFTEAMQDASEVAKFDRVAAEMSRGRAVSAQKRHRKFELRQRREDAKRAGLTWDAHTERQRWEDDTRTASAQAWASSRQRIKDAAAVARERATTHTHNLRQHNM